MSQQNNKHEIEISQEDGPSVLELSVLSSLVSRNFHGPNKNDTTIKYPLNLFNRHQRLIVYNMIAFIWSLLYLIYYLEAIDKVYDTTHNNPNSLRTNELYLSYFAMIFVGSLSIIIIKAVELKEWISRKNRKFKQFISFVHNMVGLIYLASFCLHISITWKQSNEVCRKQSNSELWFCKTTFISSGFLCIYISWILCVDTIYRNAQNTGSRIQYMAFFVAILTYLICMAHYRRQWRRISHNLSWLGELGWWLLLFSYFFALILDCCVNRVIYKCVLMLISLAMIVGSILSVNRVIYTFNDRIFYYQGWFLLVTFTGFLAYQLHSKNLQNRRRIIYGEQNKKESIAEEAPRYRFIEGSEDIIEANANKHKKDIHPLLRNKGILSYGSKKWKRNAFSVDHKKQRMIIYNLFVFVWSINMLVYFGDLLYRTNDNNNAMYVLEISASVIMLLLSVFMILMEWNNYFDFLKSHRSAYVYGCAMAYWLCSILQIAALVNEIQSNQYCAYVPSNDKRECKVGIVGSQFLGIVVPFAMCFDIIWGIWDNIRYRLLIQSFLIALSSFLYYIGYRNYLRIKYGPAIIPWYTRLSEFGWLGISVLFLIFATTLLFRDKCKFKSPRFDGMILFIIGICYMVSLGFSMSYPYGMYPIDNITLYENEKYIDSLLLIPICFILSYEIQLLTNY